MTNFEEPESGNGLDWLEDLACTVIELLWLVIQTLAGMVCHIFRAVLSLLNGPR